MLIQKINMLMGNFHNDWNMEITVGRISLLLISLLMSVAIS